MTKKLRDFETETFHEGTLFRMEYDDEEDATLALTRPKRDGGELNIEVVRHACASTRRDGPLQTNTFARIRPLAETPSYNYNLTDDTSEQRQVYLANLRPGYLYVFLNNRLWRELAIDDQGRMSDVDLERHRQAAASGETPDTRPDEGEWQESILVPVMLEGQSVLKEVRVAYSEISWSWAYIEWLEANPDAGLKPRTGDIAGVYTAYLNDLFRCKNGFRAERITHTRGVRPRDLGVELMLDDPVRFTPWVKEAETSELCELLARLWSRQEDPPMEADAVSPQFERTDNVLEGVREQPGVVSVAVPDPLFRIRHSLSQLHLALHYFDAVDQSLSEEGLSRSAVLVRQALFDLDDSPLAEYREAVDIRKLEGFAKQPDRRTAARRVQKHVRQLSLLVQDGTLTALVRDFTSHHDLGLCEAHALVADLVNVTQQLPGVLAAQGEADNETRSILHSMLHYLLSDDALLALLTPADEGSELPEPGSGCLTRERLKHLAEDDSELTEDRLEGLSLQALGLIARNQLENPEQSAAQEQVELWHSSVGKAGQVLKLVRTAVAGWSEAVLKGAGELNGSPNSQAQRLVLDGLFSGLTEVLRIIEDDLAELGLMRRDQVDFKRHSIIGVHGDNLSFGLTPGDRNGPLKSKDDYLYGDLISSNDHEVSSARPTDQFQRWNTVIEQRVGSSWVFVLPIGVDAARRLSELQLKLAETGKQFVDGPGMSRLLVGLAVYNLASEIAAFGKGQQDLGRSISGVAGGLADLTAATMKLHLVLNQNEATQAAKFIQRPWFDMKDWKFIGARLQKVGASTVARTLGLMNFAAGVIMVGVSTWDLRLALQRGDTGATQGHAMAVAGGLVFLASPLMSKLLMVPGWGWALLGLGTVFAGLRHVSEAGDDPFAKLLRHGPLGTHPDDALAQQDDTDYYPQLLTMLSPTMATAERYGDAMDPPQFDTQWSPGPDDYLVKVTNPLISRLREREDLSLNVHELVYTEFETQTPELGEASHLTSYNTQYVLTRETTVKRVQDWVPLPHDNAVCFLVQRNVEDSSLRPHAELTMSEFIKLRVGLQFRLDDGGQRLTLPAPTESALCGDQKAELPKKQTKLLTNEPVPYWSVTEVKVTS